MGSKLSKAPKEKRKPDSFCESSNDLKIVDLEEPLQGSEKGRGDAIVPGQTPSNEYDKGTNIVVGSSFTHLNELEDIDFSNYDYPFENIVFEGGGTKGHAYMGAVRVLEEAGIWKNIRRFAGASVGALNATLFAVGYDHEEVRNFLDDKRLKEKVLDHSCGYCSLIPNLIRHYGWNPGKVLFHWFGEKLQDATGNKDLTFKELYDIHKKELCVVVTNVNRLDAEYCHVKTTPDMPIRLAVRMSMSIPAVFQCVKYGHNSNVLDLYVDGGLLCNYPIHCFDGWWLSMKSNDNFLNRLQPLSDLGKLWHRKERFGEYNNKTIGLLLFSGDELEVMKNVLNQRPGMNRNPKRPNTKLARKRTKVERMKEETARRHEVTMEALTKFLQVLTESNLDKNETINIEELNDAFSKTDVFTSAHAAELFGDEYILQNVFDSLDVNGDGEISFAELMLFAERKGVDLQAQFVGYERPEVNSFAQFLSAVQDALLLNVKRMFVDDRDTERTIGIDTDYIQTSDYKMERADKDFVVEQGAMSTEAFLRYYIKEAKLIPRTNNKYTSQHNGNLDIYATNGGSHTRRIEIMPQPGD